MNGNTGDYDMATGFGFSLNMVSLQSSNLSLEEALRRVMELMKENQELKGVCHASVYFLIAKQNLSTYLYTVLQICNVKHL